MVGPAERRARLARRHLLAAPAASADVAGVARSVLALHATDAASVYLSTLARAPGVEVADVEAALYDERTVVRMLGMRRTVFVVPVDLAPIVQAACAGPIAAVERRKLVQLLEQGGIARDGARWLRKVEEATVGALAARGEASAADLGQDVPELRHQLHFGAGRKWEGTQGVSTRVLFLLAAEGRVVRGRPRGSWTSTQYRWATAAHWLPGGFDDGLTVDRARVALVEAWLRAFGPATVADLKWWTGWTLGETRRVLALVGAEEVDLGDGPGIVASGDSDAVAEPDPWVALLPSLDSTVMGWAQRDWYLGPHAPALFDRSGNAGPTVWCNGRVVGGWAQRRDGEIVHRLFEDIGREAAAAVAAAAERLGRWLGPSRVTPRFRTPLERELS